MKLRAEVGERWADSEGKGKLLCGLRESWRSDVKVCKATIAFCQKRAHTIAFVTPEWDQGIETGLRSVRFLYMDSSYGRREQAE